MPDVFHTDDGQFYQAVLALNRLVLVRLVVEQLALQPNGDVEWEWMVWPVDGPWEDRETASQGREPSLAMAKRQAFDSGITMLADITRDRAPYLPAYQYMGSMDMFPTAAMMSASSS